MAELFICYECSREIAKEIRGGEGFAAPDPLPAEDINSRTGGEYRFGCPYFDPSLPLGS